MRAPVFKSTTNCLSSPPAGLPVKIVTVGWSPLNCMVILSMGAPPADADTVVSARASGSDQSFGGEASVTGLTRSRVASRKASSAPKNSVKAKMAPVHDAKSRKRDAGKPIQRCHLRQNCRVTERSPESVRMLIALVIRQQSSKRFRLRALDGMWRGNRRQQLRRGNCGIHAERPGPSLLNQQRRAIGGPYQ